MAHSVASTRAATGVDLLALDKDPRSWELWFNLAGASEGPERARAYAKVAELAPLGGEQEPGG